MISLHKCFLFGLGVMAMSASAQKVSVLKPVRFTALAIPEPSDIAFHAASDSFYIVSDNGILFETDPTGKILRQAKEKNCDYEAVYADDSFIYAVDETHRNIHLYDPVSFKCTKIVNIPYSGARNKGYEALTFNTTRNRFVLITERDPVTLFELDTDFKITNQIDISAIARDISSACFYNNSLWLLSDEDMKLMQLNPNTYEVLHQWTLPVINPEGFAFDKDGNLFVTCDDMQRLYYFNNPEKL